MTDNLPVTCQLPANNWGPQAHIIHHNHERKLLSTCYFNNKYICTYSCKQNASKNLQQFVVIILLTTTVAPAQCAVSPDVVCYKVPAWGFNNNQAWRLQLRASLTEAGTCTSSPLRSLLITIWHPNRDLEQMDTVIMINELTGSSNRQSADKVMALYNSITNILTILQSALTTNSVATNQQDTSRMQSSSREANSSSASQEIHTLHRTH